MFKLLGYALLHRYSFNDGTTSDSVGGSPFAGSIVGSASVSGNQLMISSLGPYMSVPASVFGSYTAITIEVWATTASSLGGYARIFQLGSSVSNMASLVLDRNSVNGYVQMEYRPDLTAYIASSTVTFSGQTLHVAIVLAVGAQPMLYVNGAYAGSAPYTMTTMLTPAQFRLGGSLDGGNQFQGSIDEFRIWGGTLSASDIATRFSQGPGERCRVVDIY